MISLNNNGESELVSDTLQKLLNALPITPFGLDDMLENAGTYLIAAETALRYSRFESDADDSYIDYQWRNVLYHGFAVYMAQFQLLDYELAAAKKLSERVYPFLPERASTDELWPYKYGASIPGDGRMWDAYTLYR